MINGHPQNVNEMFQAHGYYPTRCPEHEGHAVLPDDTTGDMHCTSGHLVLPVDLGDTRIGDALKAEHWCAVVGCEHLTVTGHRFCIGHEVDDGHLDNRPEPEPGDDNHDWEGEA